MTGIPISRKWSFLTCLHIRNDRHTSFFANYAYYPHLAIILQLPNPEDPPVQERLDFASMMNTLHAVMRDEMQYTQELHQEQADKNRLLAQSLKVGNWVWMTAKKIQINSSSIKLDQKWIALYPITTLVASGTHASWLILPANLKIHPVFIYQSAGTCHL